MRLRNHLRRRASATRQEQHANAQQRGNSTGDELPVALRTRHQVTARGSQENKDQFPAARFHMEQQRAAPQSPSCEQEDDLYGFTEEVDLEALDAVEPTVVVVADRALAPMRTRRMRKVTNRGDGYTNPHTPPRLVHRKPLQRCVVVSKQSSLRGNSNANANGNGQDKRSTRSEATMLCGEGESPRSGSYTLLQDAFAQEDHILESNWLTSTLIDLMLWRLASQYPQVHFLATDFCHLHLPSITRARAAATNGTLRSCESYQIRDVLGRPLDYTKAKRPIIFVANVSQIHWNLMRVQFHPHAELQLFEPMGRLSSRSGLSYRSVPRCVIEWLDTCYPCEKTWLARGVSAITRPQQVSGFDCGVACLLYADKCGQGQKREAIDATTNQSEITTFRSELQRQLQAALANGKPPRAA